MKNLTLLLITFASCLWGNAALGQKTTMAHWTFDEGQANLIKDASGNNAVSTLKDAEWMQGVHNSGILFSSKHSIEIKHHKNLNPDQAICLQAWVNPFVEDDKASHYFVKKEGAYAFGLFDGYKLGVKLRMDGVDVPCISDDAKWNKGRWHHVAATFDGKSIKLYINGVLNKTKVLKKSAKIAKTKSNLTLGKNYKGGLDELIIENTVLSEQELAEKTLKGDYEIARRENRFTDFYEKNMKVKATAKVPGTLWIDTEDFDHYGGWWMDTQFVPQMGSPYLMAAGVGTPVENAKTTINLAKAGKYKLWVRNKNWRAEGYAPGKFEVLVNGKKSKTIFGTREQRAWVWQNGGVFDLKAGKTTLELQDLTGYYGRCDAIILTMDMDDQPKQEQKDYLAERKKYVEEVPSKDAGHFDVVVVGAGVAGCNAAIAAARGGAKVALIQDRPMVGGNNSAELGVPVSGGSSTGSGRETGLNEEIGRVHSYNYLSKWASGADLVIEAEKNITVFLNSHVFEAKTDEKKRITSVTSFDMVDNHLTTYSGDIFIDCTGDGWLAYYAGAECMFGRESQEMFGEKNAKDIADNITMSGSLFQNSILGLKAINVGEPAPYQTPEWAYDLNNSEALEKRPNFKNKVNGGGWWTENHGRNDDLWDPEWARDDLIMVSLSLHGWVKNKSSWKEKAENYKLAFIPVTNAKRETRRIVGDYILKEQDLLTREVFPDRVGYCVWKLDIHHPLGIFSDKSPYDFEDHILPAAYPFRILYAKDVSNLLMAGRHISVTHVALGSTRVQGTTGQMGQVVGTAAALCMKHKTLPRGIYENHIIELQQQLIKDDLTIPHLKNEDLKDLALISKVTASSSKSVENGPQNTINGLVRPMDDNIILKIGRVPNNMWISDPNQEMPQYVDFDLRKKRSVNSVYLTFDTNLKTKRYTTYQYSQEDRMPPECVRDYQVQIKKGNKWITVVDVKNNYQRRRIHHFDTVKTSNVRVLVTATNGDASARIFEVRLYEE